MAAHGWPFCSPQCNVKRQLRDTKQRSNWWWTEITPMSPAAGQKLPRWGIWNFSRHFKIFIYIFHDVQQGPMFPRNPLWGNLDPSYSTDSQPYTKPDSLQQPGTEPYPKSANPSPHPLPSFLKVICILSFRLRVWCERYTSFWFPTVTNPSLAAYIFLPSARCTSEKPTRRGEGGSSGESALGSYASNIQRDSQRWTQFRASTFPEPYRLCEWTTRHLK